MRGGELSAFGCPFGREDGDSWWPPGPRPFFVPAVVFTIAGSWWLATPGRPSHSFSRTELRGLIGFGHLCVGLAALAVARDFALLFCAMFGGFMLRFAYHELARTFH